MKISRRLDYSYEKHLQNVYYAKDIVDEKDIFSLLAQFQKLDTAFSQITPILFIIDYTTSKYVLMTASSKLITSYDPREFMESGLPMLIDIFHQDDYKIYNEKIFPANISFLKEQPHELHRQFIFSYNFRVKDRSGRYVPIWQRGCYITSKETGLPLYSLGMAIDLSLIKKDKVIYHSIEQMDNNILCQNKLITSNYFFPHEEDKLLTLHERNVLERMADGLSSKQIAARMHISENTISNHRKNMLKKTNTKNVAELIAFACRSGLI